MRDCSRRKEEVAGSVALLESGTDGQTRTNLPVEFQVPCHTARITKTTNDRVHVRPRIQDVASRSKINNRPVWQPRKGGDVQGHPVIEKAQSALEQRLRVLGEQEGKARPWCDVS